MTFKLQLLNHGLKRMLIALYHFGLLRRVRAETTPKPQVNILLGPPLKLIIESLQSNYINTSLLKIY